MTKREKKVVNGKRRLADLKPNPRNPRKHSDDQIDLIARSIGRFSWTVPILIDEKDFILAGHGRHAAALKNGWGKDKVDVRIASGWSAQEKLAYMIADNRLTEMGRWDDDLLKIELAELDAGGFDLELTGFDIADFGPSTNGSLTDRFGVAPFSVLNAREGWWQDRKRAWLALGIQSEVGRGENLLRFSETVLEPNPKKRAARKRVPA